MDLAIKRYERNQTLSLFFPPMLPVSLAMDEIERTNLLNTPSGKLPVIEPKDFTVEPIRNDAETLIETVAGIHCENTAVSALLRTKEVLREPSGTLREIPRWAEEMGLQPYFCNEIKRTPKDLKDYRTAIDEAVARLADLSGTHDWVLKMRRKEESEKPKHCVKPVVLADPFIARAYAAGIHTRQVPLVTTHHKDVRGRVFISVALFDENGCIVPEAAFGHMLYGPTFTRLAKSLMQSETEAGTWWMKILPTANLPILSCLEFNE